MGRSRMRRAGMRTNSKSATMFSAAAPVMAQLRRAYFALAADAACRYGVSYDRVLMHLWRARRRMARLPLRSIVHVEDLVQAIACVDDMAVAWSDLIQQNETALIRVCRRRLGEANSIVFVRRLFAELRSQGRLPGLNGARAALSLESYAGIQPLRNWLADRAQGRLVPALGNAAGGGSSARQSWQAVALTDQSLHADTAVLAIAVAVSAALERPCQVAAGPATTDHQA